MSNEELCALIAQVARARHRFTLEDAERGDDGRADAESGDWIACIYDARPGLTYRVADYPAFQAHQDTQDLPATWAVRAPRPTRNGGRDYSEEEADITFLELEQVLALDTAGVPYRLRALHVRYADNGDDRYRLVVRASAEDDRELTTLSAYLSAQGERTTGERH